MEAICVEPVQSQRHVQGKVGRIVWTLWMHEVMGIALFPVFGQNIFSLLTLTE